MGCSLELAHCTSGSLGTVVIDREGIVCTVEFDGQAFDGRFGWPSKNIVGRPFMCVHDAHNIPAREISKGVRQVCQGKTARFRYHFDIECEEREFTFELVAEPIATSANKVAVTYEKIKECRSKSRQLIDHTSIHEALLQQTSVGVLYQNTRGMIEWVNPAGQEILGVVQSQLRSLSPSQWPWKWYDKNGRLLPCEHYPGSLTLRTEQPQRDVTFGIRRPSGELFWIKANTTVVFSTSSGERAGVVTSFTDISEEYNTQAALQAQTERAQMAVESAQMGVWDWIPAERKMIWDKKLFQLYGYPDDKSTDSIAVWKKALHPQDVERVLREAEDMMHTGGQKEIDYRVVWPDGSVRHLRSQARLIKGSNGEIARVIGVTHDVTNSVMSERKLWELAYTDTLTGAYSRAGLNFRLSRTLARALQSDFKFCVLTFGLARFKEINENYGIHAGDKILTEVARRASELVGGEDTVARVGGDEFTLVLEALGNEADIAEFIRRFREQVLQPVCLSKGLVINIEAAIGVSMFPEDGGDAAALQTNAGLAMRNDRMHDHTHFTRFTNRMLEEVSRKFNLKYQLFSAVKNEEFQLYYQPIIDLFGNNLIGCEALIRWRDNRGNFVSPMEFIPVVEESGLICELGRWINLTVVKQWKLWQHLMPQLSYISINVSPRQIEQPDFVDELVAMVRAHNISPENLQLEITEGTFLRESNNADSKLQKLAFYGFRLAIDDFGTGYSSLAYLKRFNVDVIKIDRSFIRDIDTDSYDRDIVSAILAMNKKLGFKTLVEGVETERQNQIVHDLGCDSAQGYHYGRPTFADEFAEVYFR